MKTLARLGLILFISVNLFTFGCAAIRVCTVTKPCTTKLSNYDCLKIDQFTYSQAFKQAKIKDAGDEMKANILRDTLVRRVRYHIYTLSLFEYVVDTECSYAADKIVLLKGEITYLKSVTRAARFMGGRTGKARVDMDIHLVDQQTGDIIGAASVKGTSTGGSTWAGTTEDAFENAAQIIADFIWNNYL